MERQKIKNDTEVLDILLDILVSGIGSLTNPTRLSNTFKSERQISIGSETIEKYIGTPAKYYYTDLGLQNARLGFTQLEETHIMENSLYNDLVRRGMNVGVVEYNTKDFDGKSENSLRLTLLLIRVISGFIYSRLYLYLLNENI